MKIGYKKGFRDGHAEGYEDGARQAEVELAGQALAYREQGYLRALGLVVEALNAVKTPDELAEVLREIEDVLAKAAPGQ